VAAVAGLGALGVYSTHPASAQAAGQVGTSSEHVDVFANAIDASTVKTETAVSDPLNKSWNIAERPLWTNNEFNFDVDPATDSVKDIIDSMPFHILHGGTINLLDGTHAEQTFMTGTHIVNPNAGIPPGVDYSLGIIGDTTSPSNVIWGSGTTWFNISVDSRSVRTFSLRGIEFRSKIQNYGGTAHIENCILRGNSNAGTDAAVSGYSAQTLIENSTLERADHLANAKDGHRVYIKGCDGEAAGDIFRAGDGGQIFYGTDNEVIGTFPDTYYVEDWTGFDPSISRGANHPWKRINPSYTVTGGISLDDRSAIFPSGTSSLSTDSSFSTGEWRTSIEPQASPTSGGFIFELISDDADNIIRLFLSDGGVIKLEKVDTNGATLLTSGSWNNSTGVTTSIRVTRDINGNFELFTDDVSQGTASDSFLPSPSRIQLLNTLDAEVKIGEVIMR
jgi:hypothetical protein